jgi:flagellar basal body rod protein FlgG
MDPLAITAAAGMRARLESLDLVANNLSNASASGFKADRERFSLYLSEETKSAQENGAGSAQTFLPVVENRWTDTTQGELRATGNKSDLALSGQGYFQVKGPAGALFTRDGRFSVTSAGKLMTASGLEFEAESGQPIQLDPALSVNVDSDGTVRQQGVEVGRLKLVDWPAETQSTKQAGGYFQLASSSLDGLQHSTAQLRQGFQEQSNLNPAEASVRLIDIMRQFESLNKAAQIGGDLDRYAVEDVAKVTG